MTLTFRDLPEGVTAGATTTVTITDDDMAGGDGLKDQVGD